MSDSGQCGRLPGDPFGVHGTADVLTAVTDEDADA
jgi:hypothetical protein